jgi:hypothetical protein
MHKRLSAIIAVAALVVAPGLASAQVSLGPVLAYHDDFDFGIGAAIGLPIEQIHPQVDFLGDFVFFFPEADGLDYFEINGNLTYDFLVEDASVTPFALGGLSIARASVDTPFGGGDETEFGLNLGGGIKFNAGTLTPAVGAKFEISGGEGFVIFGVLPFALGS